MSLNPCKFYDIRSGKDVLIGDIDDAKQWLLDNVEVWEAKPEAKPDKDALKESIAANAAKLKIQLGDLFKSDDRLGIAKMPESEARKLYEQHKAIVETLKQLVSDISQIAKISAEEFADLVGQKATNLFKSAYNAFKSGKTSYEDFLKDNEIEIQSPQPQGEMVEKTALGRAYRGTKSEALALKLEEMGLYRQMGSIEEGEKAGRSIYEELGVSGSLKAMDNPDVDGLTAIGIYRAISEDIQAKLETETDPEKVGNLIALQAEAIQKAQSVTQRGGQVLRMWQETLINSTVPYDYTARLKDIKETAPEYYALHEEELKADFAKAKQMMEEATAAKKKLEQEIADWELRKSVENIAASVKKSKPTPQRYGASNKIVKLKTYEEDIASLKKLFSGQSGQLFSTPIPAELVRAAVFHLEAGARSFASFSKKLINDLGDGVKPYLESAYKAGLDEIKKSGVKQDAAEVIDRVVVVPHSLIRQYIEDGVTEPKDLVSLIHADLKLQHPEVTERQVRDAISNYGKTFNKGEIDNRISEMKDLLRKMSQLEDIEKQLRPLKTGLQREKLTARQRELARQVREALKTLPMSEEESAKHLKTALDAIKTRLTNEIADLDKQIERGQRTPKTKSVAYDTKATALKEQRDERKKILDDLLGNPEESIEAKIARAIRSLEESTKKYEIQLARIKQGLPASEVEKILLPETPELKRARDLRDAAKSERDAALKGTPKSPEQIRLEGLQKKLDEILQGQFKNQKEKAEDSPEVKALKEQIFKAKQRAGLIAAKRTQDEIAIEKTEKEIADLDRRISELDFSAKQKNEKIESNELKAVRSLKEEKRKKLAELKKEAFPPKTDEERRLERLQKQLDDLLQGKVSETKDKTEDSKEVKLLKDQIARQKQLMGLVNAKKTPEQIAMDAVLAAKERRLKELEDEVAKLEKGIETTRKKPEPPRSVRIDAINKKLEAANKTLKALREEQGILDRERLKDWKQRANEKIKELNERVAKGDFSTKEQKPVALDEEAERIEDELYRAREIYDQHKRMAEESLKPFADKAVDFLYDFLFNINRGVMTGADLGILAIQGLDLALRSRSTTKQAFRNLAKAFVSEEGFKKISAQNKQLPDYVAMRKAGLSLSEPHAHEGEMAKEEGAFNNMLERMWDAPAEAGGRQISAMGYEAAGEAFSKYGKKANPISALNRSQVTYMNTLRIGAFLAGAEQLKARGITMKSEPEAYEALANAINTLSGRASLYGLERSKGWLKGLTAVFLSPRNWMSILKQVEPINAGIHFYQIRHGKAPGELLSVAQKIHLKTLLRRVATTTAIVYAVKALINFMDDDEEDEEKKKTYVNTDDPRRSDFMKPVINNQMFDPWSGKMTQIVLQARIAAWMLHLDHQYTTLSSKEKMKLGEGMAPTPMELLGRYVANKEGPSVSITHKILDSKEVEDGIYRTSEGHLWRMSDEIKNMFIPMTFPSLGETYEKQPAGLREFLMALTVAGVNNTTLDKERLKTEKQIREESIESTLNPEGVKSKDLRTRFNNYIKSGSDAKAIEVFREMSDAEQYAQLGEVTSMDIPLALGRFGPLYKIRILKGEHIEGLKPEDEAYLRLQFKKVKDEQMKKARIMDKANPNLNAEKTIKSLWTLSSDQE